MLAKKLSSSSFVAIILLISTGKVFAAGTPASIDVDIKWPKQMYYFAPQQGSIFAVLSTTGAKADYYELLEFK